LKKKDECVNSLHWFGNLFLFERIQEGYDLNPGISVRFDTSANQRLNSIHEIARAVHDLLPVYVVVVMAAYFIVPTIKTKPRKKISIDGLSELSVFNFWK